MHSQWTSERCYFFPHLRSLRLFLARNVSEGKKRTLRTPSLTLRARKFRRKTQMGNWKMAASENDFPELDHVAALVVVTEPIPDASHRFDQLGITAQFLAKGSHMHVNGSL